MENNHWCHSIKLIMVQPPTAWKWFCIWATNSCWAADVGLIWSYRINLTCECGADEHSDHVALRPLRYIHPSSQDVLQADISFSSSCWTVCHYPQPGTSCPPLPPLLLVSDVTSLGCSSVCSLRELPQEHPVLPPELWESPQSGVSVATLTLN